MIAHDWGGELQEYVLGTFRLGELNYSMYLK